MNKQQKQQTPKKKATIPLSRLSISQRGSSKVSGSLKSLRQFPTGVVGTSRKSTTIIEDEYVTEISSSTAFATNSFPINPGQSLTFPWLSKIAANWEKYHINEIEFYYTPEASAYAPAAQTGKVILSCDYDAADAAPVSKVQVEDTDPHADGMPYEDICLRLDPKFLNDTVTGKYVRPGAQPANTDIKTYDAGNLYLSTSGTTSPGTCGELRVRYSVTLEKPVIESPSNPTTTSIVNTFIASGTTLTATVLSNVAFAFDITGTGITLTSGGTQFNLPVGTFAIAGTLEFIMTADTTADLVVYLSTATGNVWEDANVNTGNTPATFYWVAKYTTPTSFFVKALYNGSNGTSVIHGNLSIIRLV